MTRKGAFIAGIGVFLIIQGAGWLFIEEFERNPQRAKPLVPMAQRDDPEEPVQVSDGMRWGCLTMGVFLAALGRQFTE